MTTETELTDYLLGEVSNRNSNDYLQTYYFTHSCVDSANMTWYKAHTDYTVSQTTALWFKDSEIDWGEVLNEND